MKNVVWFISIIGVMVLSLKGYCLAQAPVPISPGSEDGTALVISGCPTFSWAEVTEATGYRVAVFSHNPLEVKLPYDDIAAVQTPVLKYDLPTRGFAWTPSADQGLCAGSYVWYAAAVQWGEVLEWSEGRLFTVDALAGLDAATGRCVGFPATTLGTEDNGEQTEKVTIDSKKITGALSLEQVISSEVAKASSLESTDKDQKNGGTAALGPIAMGVEGADNTFYGLYAGNQSSGGTGNAFFGRSAGYWNDDGGTYQGDANTFIGHHAGNQNKDGDYNTFIGYQAGYSNTGILSYSNAGDDNAFVGYQAGYTNTLGFANTFVGCKAGHANNYGSGNTFIGYHAGISTANDGINSFDGVSNTFVGAQAGIENVTGSFNVFLGIDAGRDNTSGDDNTYLGISAGGQNESGSKNVFIGHLAGYSEQGSNKLYIANSSTTSPLIYGEFDNNLVKIHGELQMIAAASPSDKRLKKDIKPLQSSLDKIQALQGVSYQWKTEKYPGWGFKESKQIGLVAQNVEDVFPELVSKDIKGYKAVSYDKLAAVLVEAAKELKAENEKLRLQLKAKIAYQQTQIDELRDLVKNK